MASVWQQCESFRETNLHMLDNEILCDMTLLAGENREEVKCHKFILASRSPVLHTMFCGSLPETSAKVEVPDIQCGVLKQMIRFLYTGEATMTPETMMQLMYAAKKYDIVRLQQICVKLLEDKLTPANVCTIFDQAIMFDEAELQRKCLNIIQDNTGEVMNTDGFLSVSKKALTTILELDTMSCQEIDVYFACKRWATAVCRKKNQDVSRDCYLREALGDLIFLIRFPAMNAEDFSEKVATENVLLSEEKNEVYRELIKPKGKTSFSNKSRSFIAKSIRVERFQTINPDKWTHNGYIDGISFKVSKACKLSAIAVYLPQTEGMLEGPLDIYMETEKVHTQNISLKYKAGEKFEYVLLLKDITLKPETHYSLQMRLNGTGAYQGKDAKGWQTIEGIDIEFLELKVGSSDNGTSLTYGQFHGIQIGGS